MTIEDNDKLSSDDAQNALNTIKQMERTSLKQSIPPIWFGFMMALTIGTLVFTIAAALRDYYVFPIIAIPLILAVRSKQTQAMPKTMPSSGRGIVALISLIIILLALISGGRYLMEVHVMTWSPLVAGALAALLIYILSIVERRGYLTKINRE